MPSYYWWCKERGLGFKCEISPEKIKKYNPRQYWYIKQVLRDLPDNEWREHAPCCGAWYLPWMRGASQVVEIKVRDGGMAILAEHLPYKFDEEIRKVYYKWHVACGRTTERQVLDAISFCLPEEDLRDLSASKVPGITRFDFDKWMRVGCPTLNRTGWIALTKCIASNLAIDLGHIITLCDNMRRTDVGRLPHEIVLGD